MKKKKKEVIFEAIFLYLSNVTDFKMSFLSLILHRIRFENISCLSV